MSAESNQQKSSSPMVLREEESYHASLPIGLRRIGTEEIFLEMSLQEKLRSKLEKQFSLVGKVFRVRVWSLGFFKCHDLLQVTVGDGDEIDGLAYALINSSFYAPAEFEVVRPFTIFPITGNVSPIIKLMESPGELIPRHKENLDDGTILRDFLHFYFWAVATHPGEDDNGLRALRPSVGREELKELLGVSAEGGELEPELEKWNFELRDFESLGEGHFTGEMSILHKGILHAARVDLELSSCALEIMSLASKALPSAEILRFGQNKMLVLEDSFARGDELLPGGLRLMSTAPDGMWLEKEESRVILGELRENYGFETNRDIQLSLYRLDFYRDYDLLLIREKNSWERDRGDGQRISHRCSIALVKRNILEARCNQEDVAEETREEGELLLPLHGNSPILHKINAEPGQLILSDPDEDYSRRIVSDYLLFFCGVVFGEEGAFQLTDGLDLPTKDGKLIVSNFTGTEFKNSSEPIYLQLAKIDFGIRCYSGKTEDNDPQEVRDATGNPLRWSAVIFYGGHLFRSEFKVLASGMVEMLNDSTLQPLPDWDCSLFDGRRLFKLRKSVKVISGGECEPTTDPTQVFKQGSQGAAMKSELRELTASKFVEYFYEGGDVCDLVVDEPLNLECDCSHTSNVAGLVMSNCVFRKPFRILGEHCGSILFQNCRFEAGLDLCNFKLIGYLRFSNSIFTAPVDDEDGELGGAGRSLALSAANVSNNVWIFCCVFSGAVFAPALKTGGNFTMQGCRIGLSREEVTVPVTLESLDEWPYRCFESKVGFGSVPALDLSGVEIAGTLELTAAGKREPWKFSSGKMALNQELTERLSGKASSVEIRNFRATVLRGNCDLSHSQVGGGLLLSGFGASGTVSLQNSKFQEVSTSFSFWIGYSAQSRPNSLRDISEVWPLCTASSIIGSIHVSGSAEFIYTRLDHSLDLSYSEFRSILNLSSSEVGGNLRCQNMVVSGQMFAARFGKTGEIVYDTSRPSLRVEGDILMNSVKIGMLEFQGVHVKGGFNSIAGDFKTLSLGLGWIYVSPDKAKFNSYESGKHVLVPNACHVGAIFLSSITVTEDLSLVGIQVGNRSMSQKKNTEKSSDRECLRIIQCNVGGNLRFTPRDSAEKLYRNLLSSRDGSFEYAVKSSELGESLTDGEFRVKSLERSGVGEGFQFVPSIVDLAAEVNGHIVLSGTKIGGHLDVRCVTAYRGEIRLDNTTVGLDLNLGCGLDERLDPSSYTFMTTKCCRLDIEKILVAGDVDLTGLRTSIYGSLGGSVIARDAEIRGDIMFVPDKEERASLDTRFDSISLRKEYHRFKSSRRESDDDDNWEPRKKRWFEEVATDLNCQMVRELIGLPRWYAKITGQVDLTAAKAKRLIISGHNVPNSKASLLLPRGEFGRLEIISPTPTLFDLQRTVVSRWWVNDQKDPGPADFASVFRQLEPFDRAAWISVEKMMRNESRQREANRVWVLYNEERYRRKIDRFRERRDSQKLGNSHRGKAPNLYDVIWSRLTYPVRRLFGFGTRVSLLLWIWGAMFIGVCSILTDPDHIEISAEFHENSFVAEYFDELRVSSATSLEQRNDFTNIDRDKSLPREEMVRSEEVVVSDDTDQMKAHLELGSNLPLLTMYDHGVSPDDMGYNWGLLDAGLMTGRYGIPMAQTFTHSRWEPSARPIFNFGSLPFQITVEQISACFTIFGWIAIPLNLVVFTSNFFRDKQSQ